MSDPYNLGRFGSLIYSRLDLPQVPAVDTAALLAWMQNAARKVMPEEANYEAAFPGKDYPWRPVWAYDGQQWDADFAAQFPQIIEYVKLFPATDWRRVNFLAQLPQASVFPHVDPDYGLGWRVYFTSGGPRLYFNRFKNWNINADNAFAMTEAQDIAARYESENLYVEPPTEPYPWAITSACAGHSVEQNTGSAEARIVMLIMPRLDCIDTTAHQDLLARSVERFADTAIWY